MSGITEASFQRVMALVTMFTPDAVDGSKTRRFLRKRDRTFDDVLEAIAKCSPSFEGAPAPEDVVASCQKAVRDEIVGRPDTPGKAEAILQLIDALLRSRHRIRHNIVVDSPSGDYTLGDVEAALSMANSGAGANRELLAKVKEANPALADADYSQASAIIAYVKAINAQIELDRDGYNAPDMYAASGTRIREEDRCKYPKVGAICLSHPLTLTLRDVYIILTCETRPNTPKITLYLRYEHLGDSFVALLAPPREPPFIDVVHTLLTHKTEIGEVDITSKRESLPIADQVGEWAAAAVASSGLFSCHTETIKQYRTYTGFMDLATATQIK